MNQRGIGRNVMRNGMNEWMKIIREKLGVGGWRGTEGETNEPRKGWTGWKRGERAGDSSFLSPFFRIGKGEKRFEYSTKNIGTDGIYLKAQKIRMIANLVMLIMIESRRRRKRKREWGGLNKTKEKREGNEAGRKQVT